MIDIRDLTIRFADDPNGPPIVKNLSLSLDGICSLFGPNGSGKTSFVRWLLGHESHRFLSSAVSPVHAARIPIGYVGQNDLSIMEWLSAVDNVCITYRLQGHDWRSARTRAMSRVEGLLEGIPLQRKGRRLSGGERRVTMLARELAREPVPSLVIIDEGFAAMDYERRFRVMDWVRRWCQTHGATVLSIGHDAEEVTLFSDVVSVISPRPASVSERIVVNGPRERPIDSLGQSWLLECTERVQRAFLKVVTG